MRSNARLVLRLLLLAIVITAAAGGAARGQGSGGPDAGPTFVVKDADLPRDFTVIIYGDMRFTDPENTKDTDPPARRALVAKIAEEHPDALVLTGDVPFKGTNPADYAEYRTETAAWRTENLRVYPVLGNHEFQGKGPADPLTNWWAAFPELQGRRWYSVALGSHVTLMCLDSNSDLTAGSPQRKWIAEQIAHLPAAVEFVFVTLHHPPVADEQTLLGSSHNARPNEIALRDYLDQIAPESHARFIVAAAHVHNYERQERKGVTYLVSGGGGAHPYPVERTPADKYQATDFPNFHYILFRFEGQKIEAKMVRLGFPIAAPPVWQVRDTFTIEAK